MEMAVSAFITFVKVALGVAFIGWLNGTGGVLAHNDQLYNIKI